MIWVNTIMRRGAGCLTTASSPSLEEHELVSPRPTSLLLTGQKFYSPTDKVGEFTIDNIQQIGLVNLNSDTKQLECLLVWLQMKFPQYCRNLAVDPTLESIQNYLDSECYSCFIF